MAAVILLLVLVLTLWSIYYYSRRELRKYAAKLPLLKGYPIVGHIEYLFVKDFQCYFDLMRTHGNHGAEGITAIWIGPTLSVIINKAKYIRVVASAATRKAIIYELVFGSYPNGVFMTNDMVKWRELRKPLNHSLTRKLINHDYHEIFDKKAKHLIQFLKNNKCGKEINVIRDICNYSFDTFSETHLGVTTDEIKESSIFFVEHVFRKMVKNIQAGMPRIISRYLTKKTQDEGLEVPKKFGNWVMDEWSKNTSEIHQGHEKYFANFIIKRMKEKRMDREETMREFVDAVFPAVDTSPIAGANAMAFLAVYPEIQEKAYREQVAILGDDPNRSPTAEDLSAMVFLDRIIKETIRLSCPEFIFKEAEENIKLDEKYTIPKGAIIIINQGSCLSDPEYWEKPTEFYPDHFLPEKEAARVPYAYTAFGFGQRICPGIHYAKRSIAMLLSYVIRNFRLSTKMKKEDFIFVNKIMRDIENAKIELEVR